MQTALDAALAYASWGWPVLPIVPNGKVPATAHGVHDATLDADQIRAWWGANPRLNVGIAAGAVSGLVVFDIDPRNGGDDSWAQWTALHGNPADGPMALTAGGGQHYLARHQPGVRSCKLRDGIDLLSDGRYFVAYPSTIEGRSYQWEASSDPFDGLAAPAIPNGWWQSIGSVKKAAPAASNGLIQGNRNAGLTSLAGSMRQFGMTEAEILAAISIANETRCEIPLPSSEIQQIARSVSRYEPDRDIAADSAIGNDAAEALLLALHEDQRSDYYLTRATSFLGQPAPVPWIIKGWLPAYGTCMIYGESGVGKTFVALDMACCVAAGLQWHGIRAAAGVVVYLAGEGNYGMRQRVAAWCVKNGILKLDNLLISNKAIDLDAPDSAARVIAAVRELTSDPVAAIYVDTLNNHMSGDENAARDTRAMINSCNVVASALGAAIVLVHHTGHGAESKQRARGSSAWRGALDASILVSGTTTEITLTCTKMKDAQAPSDLHGCLAPVDLGWFDEDGQSLPGAVFEMFPPGDLRNPQPKGDKLADHRRALERAWFAGGAEMLDGKPYVSREAFKGWMLEQGIKESSADQMLKASGRTGNIVRDLTDAKILQKFESGWQVVDRELIVKFVP